MEEKKLRSKEGWGGSGGGGRWVGGGVERRYDIKTKTCTCFHLKTFLQL